jgi:hypothetical protein
LAITIISIILYLIPNKYIKLNHMLLTMMLTHQQGDMPWAVSLVQSIEGVENNRRSFLIKEEALQAAIELANMIVDENPEHGVSLKIQGQDGKFIEERTYGKGHDPRGLNG